MRPGCQGRLTRQSSMPGGKPHEGGRLYRLQGAQPSGTGKRGCSAHRGRAGGGVHKKAAQHPARCCTLWPLPLLPPQHWPQPWPHRRRRSRAWQLYQAPKLVIRQEPAEWQRQRRKQWAAAAEAAVALAAAAAGNAVALAAAAAAAVARQRHGRAHAQRAEHAGADCYACSCADQQAPALTAAGRHLADAAAEDAAHEPVHPAWGH